ncbi:MULTISPECIES: ABC transporter ATP-binding protein [Bacillus]|uniref:Spermidine/putrescine import ATP-binding protein PotA n=1 Tax=Bacillus glycinifermentans TaxID=1664069 RepID=A0AAJ3YXQ2_9BACI|nr:MULTISPECIES: ABC transporter ATP-binding protein [Bacillus]KKB72210.1 sugar ABC transporter ATP-binding protein [Bacillus sp. TH008]MDU0072249.1 ABC transporter ATP-binding protein [Bacillus sp. IG6]MED8019874.1 ABC transporter ATP-binding protein [Bacillus glycinifermentans]QAT63875.1 ABC transporter ATP-binding protein [Bacillus glycinifermentans]WKB77751.1 ABC transporter ATP-binding protein [Bacillus glycinifermentans]
MSAIQIQHVSRHFGNNIALEDVQLEVREGEFFSLLGPSGCGKSTLLNIIAGFLKPTSGLISIGGQDVTDLPPYHRNCGMVFQDYALFPHLNVFENVAYGLKVQKVPRRRLKERVMESLSLVRLEQYAKRMPHQLSGGQRQRVAIARALAVQPSVLLLDEPLSNLDAKLRKDMQFELRRIQKRVGITTILVTHDQEEALSLSDRVGILGDGKLQQLGTPLDVYRTPANRFVAEFIGQVNLIEARAEDTGEPTGGYRYGASGFEVREGVPLLFEVGRSVVKKPYSSVLFMLRPERISVSLDKPEARVNVQHVILTDVSYIGNALRLKAAFAKGELVIEAPDPQFPELPKPGDRVYISWKPEDLVPLEIKGDENGG